MHDGDFAPNPLCYPSVSNLTAHVSSVLSASTVFSFWPEVLKGAAAEATLDRAGCLINSDLSGRAVDPTPAACRELIWQRYLKPNYYDQGVSAFWLDETDGEGTGIGDGDHGYDTSYVCAPLPASATHVRAPCTPGCVSYTRARSSVPEPLYRSTRPAHAHAMVAHSPPR